MDPDSPKTVGPALGQVPVTYLVSMLEEPVTEGGQRGPICSSGSRQRANSLLYSVLI